MQTFAAHLNAVKGAQKINGLDDPDVSIGRSYSGLALAAAAVCVLLLSNIYTNMLSLQVERALKLVKTGTITIQQINDVLKGKLPNLPKLLNKSTGKQSTLSTGFTEANWGARCRSYFKSAQSLSNSHFNEICRFALEYMRNTSRLAEDNDTNDGADNDDEDI